MATTESIPQKLLKNSTFTTQIRVDPTLVLHVLIDKHGKLFEILDGSVINVCLLENFHFISEPELQVFYSYKKSERKVFYLIKIEQKLYIILRKKDSLEPIKTFENVSGVQIRDTTNTGLAQVQITLQDEMSSIITDFSDSVSHDESEFDSQSFEKVLTRAQEMAHEGHSRCQEAAESYANLYQSACDELKFTPSHLRGDNQLEKVILVPYANNWKRIHNGFLILGLPIFNTTYQRYVQISVYISLLFIFTSLFSIT